MEQLYLEVLIDNDLPCLKADSAQTLLGLKKAICVLQGGTDERPMKVKEKKPLVNKTAKDRSKRRQTRETKPC